MVLLQLILFLGIIPLLAAVEEEVVEVFVMHSNVENAKEVTLVASAMKVVEMEVLEVDIRHHLE